jgi:hypothetical protein
VGSEEPVVVGLAETLRCALRVSPLRELDREGVPEAKAEMEEDMLTSPDTEGRGEVLVDGEEEGERCAEKVAVVEGENVNPGAFSRIPK